MKESLFDTIAAIATPIGEGAIGIVRLSGPEAIPIADRIFRARSGKPVASFETYTAHYGHVVDPATGEVVDEVLVSLFRAPKSYTREDVVEISCHGGIVPLRRTLDLLLQGGSRAAEPGEFTKRAFLNGRIDLSQAEAVIDVIKSKTEASLKVAMHQLKGGISGEAQRIKVLLLRLMATIEASIDFPEDVPEPDPEEVAAQIQEAQGIVQKLLADWQRGKIYREGALMAIVGRPNVGKSSLLNALLRENRAIVTAIPGTTRDIIEESVNIRGIPLRVVDTAGLRETQDVVERIGVERTREQIEAADLILWILDSSEPLTAEDIEIADALNQRKVIIALNKKDLPRRIDLTPLRSFLNGRRVIPTATIAGTGLDVLENAIAETILAGEVSAPNTAVVSNVRHKHALERTLESLKHARETALAGLPLDLVSIDLKSAMGSLGEITGETVADDIIHQIFAQFCIGK